MPSVIIHSPLELAVQLAGRVRHARLTRGWTQEQLAARSGIPLPTYRVFERTGQVSLERLIAVTSALGRAADWELVMRPPAPQSLDEIERGRPTRQRGLRKRTRPDAGAEGSE